MKSIFIILFSLLSIPIWSSGLNISNVSYNASSSELTFTIRWEYSWRTDASNYDGAYIFIKYRPNSSTWQHADISTATPLGNLYRVITSDNKGLLLRGTNANPLRVADFTVTFNDLAGDYYDFRVFGMEMVHIPTNVDYYVGDGVSTGRVHDGGDSSTPFLMTHAKSLGALECDESPGSYNAHFTCTDIPANFPKGQENFYVMKYHITQQQYIDFLNSLTRAQQDSMTHTDLSGSTISNVFVMTNRTTPFLGNGIACDPNIGNGPVTFYSDYNTSNPPNSHDDYQNAAMTNVTYKMVLAYLDWAAMRPISFLEYEKMCRGPLFPVANERSWGTKDKTSTGTVINQGTPEEALSDPFLSPGHYSTSARRVGYTVPSTGGTRPVSQASYYGVIGLGNNRSDIIIGKNGTSLLVNEYGDGILSTTGQANVTSWAPFTISSFSLKFSDNSLGTVSYIGTLQNSSSLTNTSFRGVRGF